jgi:UDPglucose--hexose-1-phosphate uridylyltransferase
MKNRNNESEIRNNLLTGDWVIIAPKRSNKGKLKLEHCPFCCLDEQEEPVLIYNKGKIVYTKESWTTIVIPNKFPVMEPYVKNSSETKDRYVTIKSPGLHELVISSDHEKDIANLTIPRICEVLSCYQDRIMTHKKNKDVSYVFVFQNHGPIAGASQKHPHSQIITLPFIDRELKSIINESKKFSKEHGECLHCWMIKRELKDGERIVFENDSFVAYIPFAPKFLYQVVLTPKTHMPRFEDITEEQKKELAEAFKFITKQYEKKLGDPCYNSYLHNTPCDGKDYEYFHWYFVFMPRITNYAGFEISANMEIISSYPEDQAEVLRGNKRTKR